MRVPKMLLGGVVLSIGTTCWTALAAPRPRRSLRWRTTLPWTQLVLQHETLPLLLEHSDADGEVELGQVRRKLHQNVVQRRCNKKGAERTGQEMGPWRDMDQTRHAKPPQEHHPDVQRVWNQAGNSTARRAEPVVSQESGHQGGCFCFLETCGPGRVPRGLSMWRSTSHQ